ncbi:helix-hairpin-helix domain-containing protein [Paenarthrobacter sp. DKR-5]|uniref:helix-hairpin-helix domain-containing protein n=1 Tax=Paenarthrobacter sp. DKR-5 TaxID=2835535 RepID=UPI001BDC0511|nr:helix-hairpin-helix domain-containing protein [Paenarthrobacter sp. DKR-5]MBT1001703.1 helix-hairpin-helix domain-containing protein [Paenarthrobacter sp. DKR-5]
MDHAQGRHRAGHPPEPPRAAPPVPVARTASGAAALRSARWRRLLSQDRGAAPLLPGRGEPAVAGGSPPPATADLESARRRWSLRWRVGAGAAVMLLAVAAGVLAVLWFQSATRSMEVHRVDASAVRSPASAGPRDAAPGASAPPSAAADAGLPAASGSASGTASDSASGGASGTVVVHVAGAVAKPGVFTLAAGSRVVQALQAAGGPRPEAVTAALNLAAVLSDGEQVLVPAKGEQLPAAAPTVASGTAKRSAAATRKVNLNTAGVEELTTLPKVGPVLAQRIVDWRSQHGAFGSAQELDAVEGVGPKLLEALLPLVAV